MHRPAKTETCRAGKSPTSGTNSSVHRMSWAVSTSRICRTANTQSRSIGTADASEDARTSPEAKRPGRAFEPCGLPDLPGRVIVRPSRLGGGTTRDDGLDFAPWHAPQVSPCGFRLGKVLDGRKPLLLFRFVGTLLLRFADRTFDA
jgi:hypothetical protein